MRPINSVSSSSPSPSLASGIRVWKSPIPYLFGGLALMLALISVALVILVCSYRKRANSESSSASAEDKNMKQAMPKINSEPEVLVIMAGDNKPTYLAKPISSSSSSSSSSLYCTCEAEPITTTSSSSNQWAKVNQLIDLLLGARKFWLCNLLEATKFFFVEFFFLFSYSSGFVCTEYEYRDDKCFFFFF